MARKFTFSLTSVGPLPASWIKRNPMQRIVGAVDAQQ